MKPLTERMTKGGAAKSWISEVEAKDREIERLEQTKDQYLNIIDLLACEKEQLAEENAKLKKFVHLVHKDECASLLAGNKKCDCGYNTLLTEQEQDDD